MTIRSYIDKSNNGTRKQSDLIKQPIVLNKEDEKKECCPK
jgi:hypothetical protein